MNKLTLALLAGAVTFISCNDDDLNDGNNNRAELYATSNTNGAVTVYDFANASSATTTTLNVTASTDNEGIVYDNRTDQLIFASRTLGSVVIATNIADQINGTVSTLTTNVGPSNLSSPRSIAINGDFIVVADNASNQLFIYQRSGTTLTLRNTVSVIIALWQIQFSGNDLYAVVDQTNNLAVFQNFLNNSTNAAVAPSKQIAIEGITRTHGLVYNSEDDIMILTDIGAATGAGADTDGGFHIISNFTSKFNAVANGGTLALANNQVRVAGTATFLGNPVAAAYDAQTNTIFIAERANAGGRVLGFDSSASGNVAPRINNQLAGASTVFFYANN
ncbi:hypothetical protein [Nonlabens marinus]|uniref:NHL repeat containing protein n=1 Tax=Nonlabens marinus S1-08 TaxID=1454201 RepID=W8VQI2_9FLAO|nr:hypothetical protein [Nonlabens marinus]BAO55669.1 hypothetical protein NMS_1660 [Nonlabens marinus S1-08]